MYEKAKLENEVLKVLRAENQPVGVSVISIILGVSSGTCKKVLQKLIDDGKVSPIETTKNTLFAV